MSVTRILFVGTTHSMGIFYMRRQIRFPAEGHSTFLALVSFFSAVNPFVFSE